MLKAGTYISVLMRQLNLFFGHELSDVEITASELMYLSQLYNRDGLTQEEMAAVITVDKAATTRTIQGMEKKGLVRREAHEENYRAKRVYLTDKAKNAEPRIRELQKKWVDFITQDMTQKEAEVFAAQLKKMSQRAKEINQ
ncbi:MULTISPECIES: MarR family winged helix-turn-helix transcriptional regulator [Bacteria]|jgi:DNA-binding MarR family transcriptional regulator|uniref:MarR family winged helix-turn-helix transcriptional regulator n=1 Tax=Bacteria TaxID=2 RepID=UPI000419D8FB|nr:MarR family transcriptional regulator [Butyrivibrio fibrisolvens]MBQ5991505.1 MarR family transcriptional regulator [Clostridia bacterium]MBQ6332798.1 MarR family transcriptional regulator [Clostridia bacterium]